MHIKAPFYTIYASLFALLHSYHPCNRTLPADLLCMWREREETHEGTKTNQLQRDRHKQTNMQTVRRWMHNFQTTFKEELIVLFEEETKADRQGQTDTDCMEKGRKFASFFLSF
mmetsp:Transcript_30182/g.59246  ORF Transcript_30182/g.59246 Transcript_30182/m.59246 type:complete len:114 (+) Transcript_30182:628-969(+)